MLTDGDKLKALLYACVPYKRKKTVFSQFSAIQQGIKIKETITDPRTRTRWIIHGSGKRGKRGDRERLKETKGVQ